MKYADNEVEETHERDKEINAFMKSVAIHDHFVALYELAALKTVEHYSVIRSLLRGIFIVDVPG